MRPDWSIFRRWEGLLLILLIIVVGYNALSTPGYLTIGNWVNLFQLSIEKIIVALIMTFIIINAEIDLSVASVMGFSACMMGFLFAGGMPMEWAIAGGLLAGFVAGLFNSFWIGIVGLPSLVVTLAGLIGYRGLARTSCSKIARLANSRTGSTGLGSSR